jgi:hypothetical protein
MSEVWTVTVRRDRTPGRMGGWDEKSTSLLISGEGPDAADRIVENAARQLARQLGGGKPTRPEEGGR